MELHLDHIADDCHLQQEIEFVKLENVLIKFILTGE